MPERRATGSRDACRGPARHAAPGAGDALRDATAPGWARGAFACGAALAAAVCAARPCRAQLAASASTPAPTDTTSGAAGHAARRADAEPARARPARGDTTAAPVAQPTPPRPPATESGGWLARTLRRAAARGARDADTTRADTTRADTTRAGRAGAPRGRAVAGDTTRDGAARPGGRRVALCAGQPIRDVVIVPQPPYTTGLLRRVEFVADAVRKLHATTRTSVVSRYLLLHPGEACDELRRSESERILRVQPFLVDARIRVYDAGDGGVLLEVETRDEFSLVADLAVRTAAPPITTVRLGEQNFMGAGIHASGEWRDGGRGYRDGGGGRITHYQFLGRPYQLTASGLRRWVGSEWRFELAHPFFTDLQRIAWRVNVGGEDTFQELLRGPRVDPNALFYRRRWADVGGVLRVGVPGRLSVFGAGVSREYARTQDRVAVLSDSGIAADGGPALGFSPAGRYPGEDAIRVNLIWGVRNVRFLPVTGFESLTGVQDVRRGFQFGTVFGRGASFLGSEDDDYFVSTDAYAGAGSPRLFVAAEAHGEGRRESRREQWNGVIAAGRVAGYWVPDERWRVVADAEYGGVWRAQVPTQLELGAFEGGVRGFGRADVGGGQRLVTRTELRWVAGRPYALGDVGVAAFADAGRVWAGDAPYGVTTPVRASIGIGLLGAFPARSRRTWRVDVAYPITPQPGARLQVIFSSRDRTREFFREARDVLRGRDRSVPASIFAWP